jgi:hypothetical protein
LKGWVIGIPVDVIVYFFHLMDMQELDSSERDWPSDCQVKASIATSGAE